MKELPPRSSLLPACNSVVVFLSFRRCKSSLLPLALASYLAFCFAAAIFHHQYLWSVAFSSTSSFPGYSCVWWVLKSCSRSTREEEASPWSQWSTCILFCSLVLSRRMAADTMCARRRPMSLSFWACVTLLHVCGVSPALTLEVQQQPRALFVVNAPLAPSEAPVPAAAPAPAPVLTLHQKVVGALRAAGTFGAISGALDSLTDTDPIKASITLFAPEDSAMYGVPLNSSVGILSLLNYQTAAGVYTFQQLSALKVGYKIATVTTGISILVVNNQAANYQLDNAHIARPNLYNDGSVVVHGVDAIFDTRYYNTATLGPVPAPAPAAPVAPAPLTSAPSTTAVPSSSSSTTSTSPTAKKSTDSNHAASTTAASTFTLILMASLIALTFLLSPPAL